MAQQEETRYLVGLSTARQFSLRLAGKNNDFYTPPTVISVQVYGVDIPPGGTVYAFDDAPRKVRPRGAGDDASYVTRLYEITRLRNGQYDVANATVTLDFLQDGRVGVSARAGGTLIGMPRFKLVRPAFKGTVEDVNGKPRLSNPADPTRRGGALIARGAEAERLIAAARFTTPPAQQPLPPREQKAPDVIPQQYQQAPTPSAAIPLQVTQDPPGGQVTVRAPGVTIRILPGGDVTVTGTHAVRTGPSELSATIDASLSVAFNKVSVYGATVQVTPAKEVLVSTNGRVSIAPV